MSQRYNAFSVLTVVYLVQTETHECIKKKTTGKVEILNVATTTDFSTSEITTYLHLRRSRLRKVERKEKDDEARFIRLLLKLETNALFDRIFLGML